MVKKRTRSREKTAYLIKTSSFLDFEFVSMAFAIDYVIVFEERKLNGEDETNLIQVSNPLNQREVFGLLMNRPV